jgi:hypothetical protein
VLPLPEVGGAGARRRRVVGGAEDALVQPRPLLGIALHLEVKLVASAFVDAVAGTSIPGMGQLATSLLELTRETHLRPSLRHKVCRIGSSNPRHGGR